MSGNSWLDPVRAVLDEAADRPADWFFRDDDAGWADGELWRLADTFAARAVALDIAAIPSAIVQETARRLRGLVRAGVARIYQHGKSHRNHEPVGRRCEFGPSRRAAEQLADLATGRELLNARLHGLVEPVFVPPWNRCADLTIGLLTELGFSGISRDLPGTRLHAPGFGEAGIRADWTRLWREGGPESLGRELATAISQAAGPGTGGTLGVMLHHATLTPEQMLALSDLLTVVRDHPGARLSSLTELVSQVQLAGRTR